MDQVKPGIEEGITAFTSKYELDKEIIDDLRQMLLAGCKNHVKATRTTVSATRTEGSRTRRKTGYNMYIKHQFSEAKQNTSKEDKGNSQELMAKFSKEWNQLSKEEKQPYLDMAEEVNTANGADTTSSKKASGGKKRISGYNMFYRENKDEIKAGLEEGEKLMTKVGEAWRSLSDDEKKVWNERAAEENDN